MIKIAAVLLLVISSTSAIHDPTRPIIHQQMFLKRSVETRQSSCDAIIADCIERFESIANRSNTSTTEGLARYLSDGYDLYCGSCFNVYQRYYNCTGEDDITEQMREAYCFRSDIDGKYCAEAFSFGIANGDIFLCDEKDDRCEDKCQELRTLRNYLGCCTTSFQQHGVLPNTTLEFEDCNATLGEPCSGVSTTPVLSLLVIAVLALISSSFFEYMMIYA